MHCACYFVSFPYLDPSGASSPRRRFHHPENNKQKHTRIHNERKRMLTDKYIFYIWKEHHSHVNDTCCLLRWSIIETVIFILYFEFTIGNLWNTMTMAVEGSVAKWQTNGRSVTDWQYFITYSCHKSITYIIAHIPSSSFHSHSVNTFIRAVFRMVPCVQHGCLIATHGVHI